MARLRIHLVTLSEDQFQEVKKLVRSPKTNQTIRGRLNVILLLDTAHNKEMLPYETVGKKSGTSLSTVRMVVKAYAHGGLEEVMKLHRNPNSDSARRKVDGRVEAHIIKIACGPAPEGRARWTLRLLEERCRVELEVPVSKDTIRRALKKTNFDLTRTPTGVFPQKDPENS